MLEVLENRIKKLKRVAVAYSGGIDSSFLLFMANRVLGKENVLAIIVNGCMMPEKDYKEAIEFLKENDFKYIEIQYNPLQIEAFRKNCKDRCYYCKKSLMGKVKDVARIHGFENVVDGKNTDDLKAYRPGSKAIQELNIINPLVDSGFSKSDIRKYSKKVRNKILG